MVKFASHLRQTTLLCCLACLFIISATASAGSADSDPIPSKKNSPHSAAERAQYEGVRSSASSSAYAYGSSVSVHASWPVGAAPRLATGTTFEDPSFEGGSPNTEWMESSSGGFPVICDDACGADVPRTGSWFAWFGGVAGPETSSVSQSAATFFLSDAFLSFWLRIDGCDQDDSNTDLFTVTLDGIIIYQLDENSALCGTSEYQRVVIDIFPFNTGGSHLLGFEFTGFGPNITNLYLDDVELLSSAQLVGSEQAVNPADGGLERGAPNPSWSESSTTYGTPICDAACNPQDFAPRTGDFAAWFGAVAGIEDSSIAQMVTLPVDQTALSFWLRAQLCDEDAANVDNLRIEIDGVPVLTFDENSPLCGAQSYSRHVADISPWADGGIHELAFRFSGFGPGTTNFFVDDIEILSSLEAYYPFDTDAMDHSGNGRHATLEGGATLGRGIVGGALDLTQGDGWADIAQPVLDRHTECTIAYSIKVESTTPGSPTDACCNAVFAENGFPVGALHSNLNLGFGAPVMEWSLGGWSDGAFSPALPSVAFPSWTHYAMTYRSSLGEVHVYQDGVLVDTIEQTSPFCGAGLSSQIGAWQNGETQGRFLDAMVDEVWIYSRVLTEKEIQSLVTPFFADGFESGSTNAWSSVVGSISVEVLMAPPER